jgi:hypothetical protein
MGNGSKQMANGQWVRDGRDKGMESALWLLKGEGMPRRGGKLAAASRR